MIKRFIAYPLVGAGPVNLHTATRSRPLCQAMHKLFPNAAATSSMMQLAGPTLQRAQDKTEEYKKNPGKKY